MRVVETVSLLKQCEDNIKEKWFKMRSGLVGVELRPLLA